MTGHWHLTGTGDRVHISMEAETVLGNWGKKGLKWHIVRDRVLAEKAMQVFQC